MAKFEQKCQAVMCEYGIDGFTQRERSCGGPRRPKEAYGTGLP